MDYIKRIEQYEQENKKLQADLIRFNDMLASYQNVLVPELREQLERLKTERDFLRKENWKMQFHVIPSKSGAIVGLQMKVEDLTSWLDMLKETLAMAKADLEKTTRERDAAVEQLHGICSACVNYTPNHNEGPCRDCQYETARYPMRTKPKDNWRWNGGRQRGSGNG